MRALVLLLLLALPAMPGQAATEYLRIQGTMPATYGPPPFDCPCYPYGYFYDPALGLSANQPVYFDFAVDTLLNVAGHPDTFYQDHFAVSYLGGSVPTGYPSFGRTSSFPEGVTTWFYLPAMLSVGSEYTTDNFGNRHIDSWVVGQPLVLMLGPLGYVNGPKIRNFRLTYRGAAAPPAIVPLPASGWLFAAALAGLRPFVTRRRRDRRPVGVMQNQPSRTHAGL